MLNFPASPTLGQEYIYGTRTWVWNGIGWALKPVVSYGSTDNVAEGSTNRYFTVDRARGAISVTGGLTYNSSTGVITGPDLSGYLTGASAASMFQQLDGDLSAIAGLSGTSGILKKTAANTWALDTTSYLPLAGGTLTGGLTFNGTGQRISGDFSNATMSNRLMFQTSTANSQTLLGVIPNGTTQNAQFQAYNNSDPNNASVAALVASASQVRIVSGYTGTGTLNPITFIFNSTEAARITPSTMNLLVGTSTDDGVNKLQVNGGVSATQFNGSAAGLTGFKTVNGSSILGSGDITIIAGVSSFNTRTGAITLTSSDVTTALGFTPYNATNQSGYVTQAGARSAISATGSLSYNSTTGVISYTAPTALSSFTNDSGFITSSALSPYLTSATAASTYQTQVGMGSYLTTASAASTYLPLAGGSLSGNLDFSGANRRITGDFTSTSRVLVQTTSANSNTVFGLIPNGTAANSQFHVWGASDITNAPLGAFTINSGTVQIQSTAAGTGTVLPFRILIGSTEALRIDATTQNLLVGTSTDSGNGDKLQVNGSARFGGQVGGGPFRVYGASGSVFNSVQSGSTGSYTNHQNGGGAMQVGRDDGSGSQWGIANANAVWGTGAYPVLIGVNGGEAMRFNPTTRNALIGTTTDNSTDKLQVNGGLSVAGALRVGATPSAGTSGQVLTSAGAGAAPTWVDVSSGSGGLAFDAF